MASYFNEWLYHVRSSTGKSDAFAVAEYWEFDINKLNSYVDSVNNNANNKLSAFDVPLHYRFFDVANAYGGFDMRTLLTNNLLAWQPSRAVTFVGNHDTLECFRDVTNSNTSLICADGHG